MIEEDVYQSVELSIAGVRKDERTESCSILPAV